MTTLTSEQLTQIQQGLDNNEYDTSVAARIYQTEITFKHWKTEQAVNNDVQKLWDAARNGQESLDAEYEKLNDKWFKKGNDRACDYLGNAWDCISTILQKLINDITDRNANYPDDAIDYPAIGDITGVHNTKLFYIALEKLNAIAQNKGLDITNWFDGDFNWNDYLNDPDIAIVVWGKDSTNVYSQDDKKWYSNITFEPSDQGLKQLAEFVKNYNANLSYCYCEECAHDNETTDTKCWNCGSSNIKSGTVKYNDRSVFFQSFNDDGFCWECFKKQSRLNVMSDAIANIWDDQLKCCVCENSIESIVARNHANK